MQTSELKALAYDLIRTIEKLQNDLRQVNDKIISQEKVEPVSKTEAPPPVNDSPKQ